MSILKIFTKNDFTSILSFFAFLFSLAYSAHNYFFISFACLFLALGISSAVHSAEVIAQKVGPSLGTIVLALAVTVIEVALIVSLMNNGGPEASQIARDTVFAAVMIVSNGIIGFCILIGGIRHRELTFKTTGTGALLSVLAVLSVLTFVLPSYTTSASGASYTQGQLIFVSVCSVILYAALIFAQTKTHKDYFVAQPMSPDQLSQGNEDVLPSTQRLLFSFLTLFLSLVAVVGLAKILSPSIEDGIDYIGAPKALVGILIALLVLAPETLAALKAAQTNQLQTSLNLALGSGAASIALTIPVVSIYSIYTNNELTLGLDEKGNILLLTTFLVGGLTIGIGKSTALHGIVHLVILAAYIALALMP